MTIDEYGIIWLTNPWIAATFLFAAIGLFVWSHAQIAHRSGPRMAVRARRTNRRRHLPALRLSGAHLRTSSDIAARAMITSQSGSVDDSTGIRRHSTRKAA